MKLEAERSELNALIRGAEGAGASDKLRQTLAEIAHALAKFGSGGYGKCETCARKIAYARLYEAPAVRLCVTCAGEKDPEATLETNDDELP